MDLSDNFAKDIPMEFNSFTNCMVRPDATLVSHLVVVPRVHLVEERQQVTPLGPGHFLVTKLPRQFAVRVQTADTALQAERSTPSGYGSNGYSKGQDIFPVSVAVEHVYLFTSVHTPVCLLHAAHSPLFLTSVGSE